MLVQFIVPTYDRIDPLRLMLSSLMAQNCEDWSCNVVIDEPEPKNGVLEVIEKFETHKIYYTIMDKRYNDWGHTPREYAKQRCEADYILMTGDDNYYTPNLVEELKYATKDKPGMVYWDMVHSHYGYSYFKCAPHTHQIDMGAFATRTDLAKQIKLNTSFAADGDFIEDFKKKFPREQKIKINKVLFVHN